ncbi:MAG TPA: response regulator transcription factor [Alphaproteobacteria bacterium]|nr:response regulator transcription factor [Alphaproteobacteria bacterium]
MKKILYVEDNPDTNEAVKIILTKAGFEVDTALNGKDGLKKAGSTKFDLILLDVMLPDMSGWDIYAQLKPKIKCKYAFLSAIPVSGERMEELLREGVSDYITKPFVKADLISRVKKILS